MIRRRRSQYLVRRFPNMFLLTAGTEEKMTKKRLTRSYAITEGFQSKTKYRKAKGRKWKGWKYFYII